MFNFIQKRAKLLIMMHFRCELLAKIVSIYAFSVCKIHSPENWVVLIFWQISSLLLQWGTTSDFTISTGVKIDCASSINLVGNYTFASGDNFINWFPQCKILDILQLWDVSWIDFHPRYIKRVHSRPFWIFEDAAKKKDQEVVLVSKSKVNDDAGERNWWSVNWVRQCGSLLHETTEKYSEILKIFRNTQKYSIGQLDQTMDHFSTGQMKPRSLSVLHHRLTSE